MFESINYGQVMKIKTQIYSPIDIKTYDDYLQYAE